MSISSTILNIQVKNFETKSGIKTSDATTNKLIYNKKALSIDQTISIWIKNMHPNIEWDYLDNEINVDKAGIFLI